MVVHAVLYNGWGCFTVMYKLEALYKFQTKLQVRDQIKNLYSTRESMTVVI